MLNGPSHGQFECDQKNIADCVICWQAVAPILKKYDVLPISHGVI